MKRIVTVSSICVLCLLFLTFGAAAQKKVIRVGDKLPGFFLKNLDGENFFLRDYIGENAKNKCKAMILSLSASYCKPCKKEIPELGKMMEKHKDKAVFGRIEGNLRELVTKTHGSPSERRR